MGPDGRIRVLWLAKGLGQGGMERLLVTHAKFGDRDRFDYRAAYLVDRPYSVIGELRELDVPVTRLGNGSGSDPRWLRDLLKLVRRERIDVVHGHSPMPAAMARPVLRVLTPRTRLVYTEHNTWDRYSSPTRLANMVTYPQSHWNFAVSDDSRESVSPRLRRNVETLTHGIDVTSVASHRADREAVRSELGIGEDDIVVGTVANLRAQKNYPMLLEVAAEITALIPNVVFVAVGQGPLEQELSRLHERMGLGNRFRFLGFRSDVLRVMSGFDVFCLSSDHEGLPVSFMEATALGIPTVSTSVGGLVDNIESGKDGLLVQPGDTAQLAAALRRVVSDRLLLNTMSQAVVSRSNRFDATAAIRRQEEVYDTLIQGPTSG